MIVKVFDKTNTITTFERISLSFSYMFLPPVMLLRFSIVFFLFFFYFHTVMRLVFFDCTYQECQQLFVQTPVKNGRIVTGNFYFQKRRPATGQRSMQLLKSVRFPTHLTSCDFCFVLFPLIRKV